MLRTLLHKTLLTAIAILLGGWAVVAQHNVVKGTALSFKADENPAIDFRWEIYSVDAGSTVHLTSNTHISEEYTFSIPGDYEVRVYPVDKVNRCLGEPLISLVSVARELPTISFDDLAEAYVCSSNNGVNPRAEISCTVNYTGPIPWTFKYSVDREPAILPEGANEIWSSSFDFVVTIRNASGKKSRSEIMIVEAKSISGLEIVENIDDHRVEIDVLYLPDTQFLDIEPTAMAGTLQAFKAIILKHDPDVTPTSPANSKRYEISVPDGATILNEATTLLADERHSELTFDIQWGDELGPKKVKLIEKNAFNCYGDTIFADINVVEFDDFTLHLEDEIQACINDVVTLDPKPNSISTREYSYLWSTDAITPTINVQEPGIYSVVVTDNIGNVKRDEVEVFFNALPIVDLGEDRYFYEDESVILDAGDAGVGATYLWNTGALTQTIDVTEEGDYSITITNSDACSATDDVKVIKKDGQKFTVDLGDDIEICEGERAYLEPSIDRDIDATYKWIPGEATDKGIYVDKKGKYCVEVSDEFGNKETACVDVDINPSPIVDLGDDISLEAGETVVLDAGNEDSFFVWSTGAIEQTIEVSTAGDYSVAVTNTNNCIGRDEVKVSFPNGQDYVGLPSGFTPNGDGNNDVLYVRGNNIKAVTFMIYNRGGRKIFQSNRLDVGWDGTFKGQLQRMDAYMYVLIVSFDNGTSVKKQGEVTLVN